MNRKPMEKETKEKISRKLKGRKLKQETKKAIGKSHTLRYIRQGL